MKTAKEFLSERLILDDVVYDNMDRIVGSFTDLLDEFYNEALQDALKNGRCEYKGDLFTGNIDPDSILQLLKL